MMMQAVSEFDMARQISMATGGMVAYDPDYRIAITTGRGRVKQGNTRKYHVLRVAGYRQEFGRVRPAWEKVFGFRAYDDYEAVKKFKADRRAEPLYAELWQRGMNDFMVIG